MTDIGSPHSTRRGVGACGTESATVTTEVMCQVGWEAWCPVNPREAVTFQKHFLHLNHHGLQLAKFLISPTHQRKSSLQVLNAKESSEAWGIWGS